MSPSSIENKYGPHKKEGSWKSHLGSEKKKVQNVLLDIELNFIDSISETYIFTSESSNAYKEYSIILQIRNSFLRN